jgi:hypothetical protein
VSRKLATAAMLIASSPFFVALVSVGYAADSPQALRELRTTARIRAAVYLRGLRELDSDARRHASVDPEHQVASQALWTRIASIPAELERMRKQAEMLAGSEKESADSLQNIASDVAQLAQDVQRMDQRYRPLLGTPHQAVPRRAVAPQAGGTPRRGSSAWPAAPSGVFVSGRVSAAGGSARFDPVNLPNSVQQSATPDVMLQGGIRPNESMALTATLSHKRLVEQLAVMHTDAGLTLEHTPNRRLRYRAEAGYGSYGEEDFDVRDYGEARLQAGAEYTLAKAARLDAQYRLENREHAETPAADFANHRIDGALRLETGGVRVQGFVSYQKRDVVARGSDFTRQEPRVVIESAAPGRAPSGIAAALETYDFPADVLRTSRRLRADAYLGRGQGGTLGIGYVGYERPEASDSSGVQGYEDFSVYSRQRTSGRASSGSSELALVYRRNRSGPSPDYAGLTLHRRTRVHGSWLPRRELHVATRVYQSSDDRATGEHSGDLKALVGWDVGGPAGFQVGVDAFGGGCVFVDPDAKDNADPDDDGALDNRRNSAKFGGAFRLSRTAQRGLQLSGSVKLERDFVYNAEPTQTQSDLDVSIDARYPLSLAWQFEAAASLFRSRTAGIDASTDFDRSNIRIGTTYLFNAAGGSQR